MTRSFNGEKVPLINSTGTTGSLHAKKKEKKRKEEKKEIQPLPSTTYKYQLKLDQRLNVKSKIMKVLEGNIGVNLLNIVLGNGMTPNAHEVK